MAEVGDIELYTSLEILYELEDVLRRDKFRHRIATLGTNVEELMNRVRLLMNIVEIEFPDQPIVHEDSDAPNVIVFERLEKDFGSNKIFHELSVATDV